MELNYPDVRLDRQWIFDPITPDIVKWCESFGHFLAPQGRDDKKALTTSQLRRFFGEVKRIKLNTPSMADIAMLNPLLAYAVGRDKKDTRIKDFYNELSTAISAIRNDHIINDFENFTKLLEAIVAYHKYYESLAGSKN